MSKEVELGYRCETKCVKEYAELKWDIYNYRKCCNLSNALYSIPFGTKNGRTKWQLKFEVIPDALKQQKFEVIPDALKDKIQKFKVQLLLKSITGYEKTVSVDYTICAQQFDNNRVYADNSDLVISARDKIVNYENELTFPIHQVLAKKFGENLDIRCSVTTELTDLKILSEESKKNSK